MAEAKEKLFPEFPPVSAHEWTAKIISDLKGILFEKKMIWHTDEGVVANPFYTSDDMEGMATLSSLPGQFPFIRGAKTNNEWLVRQDMDVDDCRSANEKAKFLIENCGVTSLGFQLKSDWIKAESIAQLLNGICPVTTELNFWVCNRKAATFIGLLTDYFRSVGVALSDCKGSIAYDPFNKPLI